MTEYRHVRQRVRRRAVSAALQYQLPLHLPPGVLRAPRSRRWRGAPTLCQSLTHRQLWQFFAAMQEVRSAFVEIMERQYPHGLSAEARLWVEVLWKAVHDAHMMQSRWNDDFEAHADAREWLNAGGVGRIAAILGVEAEWLARQVGAIIKTAERHKRKLRRSPQATLPRMLRRVSAQLTLVWRAA